MNRQQWVKYINRHIPLGSGLPRLTEEELQRWQKKEEEAQPALFDF